MADVQVQRLTVQAVQLLTTYRQASEQVHVLPDPQSWLRSGLR